MAKTVVFSTGNSDKFLTAQHVCKRYGVELVQADLDIDEIQGEDPQIVATDKARKAFSALKKPVVITDDSWAFSGLNGFPGVYMHSMNTWLTPADFLRLTLPLHDRRVTRTQYLIYDDGIQQKIFSLQSHGSLLTEARGASKHASHTVISLDGENGLSIAEVLQHLSDKSTRPSAKIWHNFITWFEAQPY